MEHLLTNPDNLYRLYNYRDIQTYYPYNFLPSYNSIDVDIFYDILNSLSNKKLFSLHKYIYQQWSLTTKMIEIENVSPHKRKKIILQLSTKKLEK